MDVGGDVMASGNADSLRELLEETPHRVLEAIAQVVGVYRRRRTKAELVDRLERHLADDGIVESQLAGLSADARAAVIALRRSGGRLPAEAFEARFGELRRYRPWRADSPRAPWREPGSAAEELVYSGLVFQRRGSDRARGALRGDGRAADPALDQAGVPNAVGDGGEASGHERGRRGRRGRGQRTEVVLSPAVLRVWRASGTGQTGGETATSALGAAGRGRDVGLDLAVFVATLAPGGEPLTRGGRLRRATVRRIAQRKRHPANERFESTAAQIEAVGFLHFLALASGLAGESASGAVLHRLGSAEAWLAKPPDERLSSLFGLAREGPGKHWDVWRRLRLPGWELDEPRVVLDVIQDMEDEVWSGRARWPRSRRTRSRAAVPGGGRVWGRGRKPRATDGLPERKSVRDRDGRESGEGLIEWEEKEEGEAGDEGEERAGKDEPFGLEARQESEHDVSGAAQEEWDEWNEHEGWAADEGGSRAVMDQDARSALRLALLDVVFSGLGLVVRAPLDTVGDRGVGDVGDRGVGTVGDRGDGADDKRTGGGEPGDSFVLTPAGAWLLADAPSGKPLEERANWLTASLEVRLDRVDPASLVRLSPLLEWDSTGGDPRIDRNTMRELALATCGATVDGARLMSGAVSALEVASGQALSDEQRGLVGEWIGAGRFVRVRARYELEVVGVGEDEARNALVAEPGVRRLVRSAGEGGVLVVSAQDVRAAHQRLQRLGFAIQDLTHFAESPAPSRAPLEADASERALGEVETDREAGGEDALGEGILTSDNSVSGGVADGGLDTMSIGTRGAAGGRRALTDADAGALRELATALEVFRAMQASLGEVPSRANEASRLLGRLMTPFERSAAREAAQGRWSLWLERGPDPPATGDLDKTIGAIERAIDERRAVRIRYWSNDRSRAEWRDVTPHELRWAADTIYLSAHCHLRDDERTFRLDRILGLEESTHVEASGGEAGESGGVEAGGEGVVGHPPEP